MVVIQCCTTSHYDYVWKLAYLISIEGKREGKRYDDVLGGLSVRICQIRKSKSRQKSHTLGRKLWFKSSNENHFFKQQERGRSQSHYVALRVTLWAYHTIESLGCHRQIVAARLRNFNCSYPDPDATLSRLSLSRFVLIFWKLPLRSF